MSHSKPAGMPRRQFLYLAGAGALGATVAQKLTVRIAQFNSSGKRTGFAQLEVVQRTPDEWRKLLTGEQFEVTREAATEEPFTGEYSNFHGDGLYACVCCGTALFDSKTKFESGTGWPSFWAPIAEENVSNLADHSLGMQRVEVRCARCYAHLGHVFDDGPPPAHLRYCMNSLSLKFAPRRPAA